MMIFVSWKTDSIEMKVEVFCWAIFLFLVNYVSILIKISIHCLLILFLFKYQSDSAKYELELERVEPLPEPNIVILDTFRVKKFNRSTYVLNGNFTLKERFDDTLDVRFINYNFQGREYRKIFERLIQKFCTSLFVEPLRKLYESFVAHSDLPKFGDCDFPPVRINHLINLSSYQIKIFFCVHRKFITYIIC